MRTSTIRVDERSEAEVDDHVMTATERLVGVRVARGPR
jgi:hypothetical protein